MRTITERRDIDSLFTSARRVTGTTVSILVIRRPEARDPSGRVLFVAGKRLGNAVVRNRMKRVLRETVRRAGGPWEGWDVAVMARPATADASPGDLDRVLSGLLRKAGVL